MPETGARAPWRSRRLGSPLASLLGLVRRPSLTLGFILLSFLATLALPSLPTLEVRDGNPDHAQAFSYWRAHGYLEPGPETAAFAQAFYEERSRPIALAAIRELGMRARPQSAAKREAEQQRLLSLETTGVGASAPAPDARAGHPLDWIEYAPRHPSALSFVLHGFVHVGWWHWLWIAVGFAFVGTKLERSIGARALACVSLAAASGGAATATFLARWTQPANAAMGGEIGAATVVTGLVAYAWTRERTISPWRPRQWSWREAVEVFALPLGWLALAALAHVALDRTGASSGGAIHADVGAGLTGAALACWPLRARRPLFDTAALTMRFEAIRSRLTNRALERNTPAPGPAAPPSIVDEAWVAYDMGEIDRAYALFRRAARSHPADPEITRALWDVATSMGQTEEVAQTMTGQIRRCLRRGDLEAAADLWCELVEHLPEQRLPAEDLFRLVTPLLERHRSEFALAALRQCVDAPRGELSIGLALQILETAEPLDPTTALLAARRTLELPDLHESKRARILERVQRLDPEGAEQLSRPATAPRTEDVVVPPKVPLRTDPVDRVDPVVTDPVPIEPEPALIDPEQDEGKTDEAFDLANLPRFDALQQVDARPISLDPEVLYLELSNGRRAKVAWGDIQAIGVAAVRDLGARPVVVIDLLLNWRELGDAPLRSIRLRSDRFDPSRLLAGEAGETGGAGALRRFLDHLLERTRAVPLPDRASARGAPFRAYEFTRTYQRRVLKVDC